jgi:hypothetical protein
MAGAAGLALAAVNASATNPTWPTGQAIVAMRGVIRAADSLLRQPALGGLDGVVAETLAIPS